MPAVVEPLGPAQELPVEPGKEAVARFSIRNTGDDVNNFTFRVVGEPSRWPTGIRVVGRSDGERKPTDKPPELDLLPNEKGEVELTFRPPEKASTAAGLVPYGLLVCSYAARDDKREEDIEAVEEGLLDVGLFHKRAAQLLPRTSRGRYFGRHRLAVDNYGNSTAVATFAAEDAENFLDVRFSPRSLVVAPGTVGFTRVKVKPRSKFMLGPPRAAPFKIFVTFERDALDGDGAVAADVPPVDGLYMQRAVLPTILLPLGVLLAVAVILWAIFRPQADPTAPHLAAAQEAAKTLSISDKANVLARQANELTRSAIKTAHKDAMDAQKQSAQQAKVARQDAKETQKQVAKAASATQKQVAKAASASQKQAKQTTKQAAAAKTAASTAGVQAAKAARAANKALQAATPAFAGAPFGQQLALPADCTPSCTAPQPFSANPFPAHAYYATDVLVGNLGSGKGTLTLTLGGKPVLVESLGGAASLDLKPTTPLLVQGAQTLGARLSCAEGPCRPSVFVSGFSPAKAPDAGGPHGAPTWTRLSQSCQPVSRCAVMTVPAKATSFELTDVVFQNPAGDTGTVTLSRGNQPLLVEGLDAKPGDLPLSLTAPIALKGGEKLTLTVACGNAGGKECTPGALLVGVLRTGK